MSILLEQEQRASIALGMESLKVRHVEEIANQTNLLMPTNVVPSVSKSTFDRVLDVTKSALKASKHNKACRKVFRSNNAIEKEQSRHAKTNAFIIHPFSPLR